MWNDFVSAASLGNSSSPLQMREKLYLLAVGYYRNGDYPRSRQVLERCLEVWSATKIFFYLSRYMFATHKFSFVSNF